MWKYVAILIAFLAAGGAGFYFGEQQVVRINSHELASARDAGASAQAQRDAADYAKAAAASKIRLAVNTKADIAEKAIVGNRTILVPVRKECKISAIAMRKLNDPDLIGKDAQ